MHPAGEDVVAASFYRIEQAAVRPQHYQKYGLALRLQQLNERGITIVLVTHEPDIATYCKRVVRFRDGRVIEDVINPDLQSAAQALRELPDEALEEGP